MNLKYKHENNYLYNKEGGNMTHNMYLNDDPFNKMKNGSKTIELRLNDEKRQLLKVNDYIEFTNRKTLEKILVVIIALFKYPNFKELYKNFNKIEMGYEENEIAQPEDMEKYYGIEEQKKYGVLGIKVKRLN